MIVERIGLVACAVIAVPHEYTEPHAAACHLGAHERLLLAVEQLKHRLLQILRYPPFLLVKIRVDCGSFVTQSMQRQPAGLEHMRARGGQSVGATRGAGG